MRSLWLFFLFTAAVSSFAQEKKLSRLEGRVINSVTGEPVRKAKLNLSQMRQGDSSSAAVSDAEGRFVFENVEPGTYTLSVEKFGYLHQTYGSGPSSSSIVPLTLAAGQTMKDLEFKLAPQGVISGKVLDEDGEPVSGASVMVLRQGGSARRQPRPVGGGQSNDLGEFRLSDLTAGRYVVSVGPPFRFSQNESENRAKADAPAEVAVATYYPGVTDPNAAQSIEIKTGQEITGIVIALQKARVYRVEGKLAGLAAGQATQDMQLSLSPRGRGAMNWGFGFFGGGNRVKPDGSFTIPNVQPGSYNLSVFTTGGGMPRTIGRTPVDVTDDHLKGVVVPLIVPLQITGVVRVEGDQKVSLNKVRIALMGEERFGFGTMPSGVGTDGTFKFESVTPEKYYLSLIGTEDTVYVKSVQAGRQEVRETGMDLSEAQGAVAVEVVLGTKPGAVEGTVQNDGKAVPGIGVTMVPDPPQPWQRQLSKFASADQNGRFAIKGAAPGNYKLYAVQDSSATDMFFDPDAMKPYESKGVTVTVEEGRTARAELSPIKADETQAPAQ